ncbi:MAG: SprT-like domain-containing protein [Bacteroidales bacterium]|nr:SprT-like domain-containing protein [Bacteroidales bacterium]
MKEKELLAKYLPPQVVDTVLEEIIRHRVHLKITRSRKTKLGDFRPHFHGVNPRISVNNDLNQYAFFVTFIHELSHLLAYEKYGHMRQPHGEEWKQIYGEQLGRFLGKDIFPSELEKAIKKHLKNIKASSHSDLELTRAFQKYDTHQTLRLEDLQQGEIFVFQQDRKFKILEKVRKRYKCQEIANNRIYLFNALTPVKRHE